MKFRGKAITGTSLLTIVGVLCFATVIVSAVLISSSTLTFASTNVTSPGSIALTQKVTPGTIVLGNDADYEFNANVPTALTSAYLTIDIAKTSIQTEDVTSATIQYDGGYLIPLSFTGTSGHITATYSVGPEGVDSTIPCIVSIVYATAGTYTVSVVLAGNA